jgi:hypothetical protein
VYAGPWIAAYIAAILLWSVALMTGNAPTLWRGNSLFLFNGLFIAASVVAVAAMGLRPTLALAGFDVVLIVVAVLVRNVWLLLHVDRAGAEQILEDCFEKTRARYTGTQGDYALTVAESQLRVLLDALGPVIRLRFLGDLRSKKAGLIRALIMKQFRGSFPALRMRA